MKKLIKVVAIIASVMLTLSFIACSNHSSSDSNSNDTNNTNTTETTTEETANTSTFDSKLAGSKYTYEMSGFEFGYIFNSDYSVKQINAGTATTMSHQKWRIVENGAVVEIYTTVAGTVTASFDVLDTSFSQLKMGGQIFTRQ